jgi:hypothetical protein
LFELIEDPKLEDELCYMDDIYAYILKVLEHQLKITEKMVMESDSENNKKAMYAFMHIWTNNQKEVRSLSILKLCNLKV